MNRRQFLLGSTALAAGCGRRVGPVAATKPVGPHPSEAAREQHLEMLEGFVVPPNATLTTPPAPFDVLSVAPELKGLIKVSMRLHPRFSKELGPDESKLGGLFAWSTDEPWPTATNGEPLAPILQLRAEDAPPNWSFPPDTDLFQLFWHAADDRPSQPSIRWTKRAAIPSRIPTAPSIPGANLDLVPVPCRLFPERVMEFPNVEALPAEVKAKLGPKPGIDHYKRELSIADGTKVGGYPTWTGAPEVPACTTCKWGMDFLLTIADREWNDDRWKPIESAKAGDGHRRATGLRFGERGNVHVYICRRCETWPVKLA